MQIKSSNESEVRKLFIIFVGLFLFLIGSLSVAILYYPLSWGLMDDGQNLRNIRSEWLNLNFFEVMRQYSTIHYFRPVYTLFVYVGYHLFVRNPKGFYFFNFLFILVAIYPWGKLIHRQLHGANRKFMTLVFCFFLLAATPLYNLIVYLSLQEKFVIFFAGWSFLALDLSLDDSEGRFWWPLQITALVCFVFGMWSKPTMIACAPWAILALAFTPNRTFSRRWLPCIIWLVTTLAMARVYLRRTDDYSSRYTLDWHTLSNYLFGQPKMSYFCLAIAAAAIVIVLLDGREAHGSQGFVVPRPWVWPITLIFYITALLPWAIATYLWAPAMVLTSGVLVLLIDWVLTYRKDLQIYVMPLLLASASAAAAVVVFHVAIPRLARQSEIGQTVKWLSEQLPKPDIDIFVMVPCAEASWNLQYQTGDKQPFYYLGYPDQAAGQRLPHAWLITRDECPRDTVQQAQFQKIIFQLPHWTIYSNQPRQG